MTMGTITGYTLYVNQSVVGIYDTYEEAWREARRYGRWNEIDVQPLWSFNDQGEEYVG